jgi:hypothetical protein
MSLNPNQPIDQTLNSEWPSWIRAIHAYINTLEDSIASGNISVTTLSIEAGDISLTIGSELSSSMIEVIFASAAGACNIANIYGGSAGQIKVFIFTNNLISFQDGAKESGKIYLNQLPVLGIFNAQSNDVLVLANVGGDGSDNFGWWKELYRQMAVK